MTEAEQRLARAAEMLANGLPTTTRKGEGLFVAFKTLARQKKATMTPLPNGWWAVKTTDRSVW